VDRRTAAKEDGMGRRALVVTGVVVLVLGAGVAVADQALRAAAEQRISGPVSHALGADSGATVQISEGRPFLLQVAGGRLDRVTVTADHLSLDGTDVTNAHMDAAGVTIRSPYTARDVTATGTVPTASIQQRLTAKGLEVGVAVAGQDLRASGTVLGLPWSVLLTPVAAGDRVTVTPTSADIAGVQVGADALPASVKDAIAGVDVPVSGLPRGLAITGAQVVDAGVQVTMTGRDVVLPG
jgi:hypothetical protein